LTNLQTAIKHGTLSIKIKFTDNFNLFTGTILAYMSQILFTFKYSLFVIIKIFPQMNLLRDFFSFVRTVNIVHLLGLPKFHQLVNFLINFEKLVKYKEYCLKTQKF